MKRLCIALLFVILGFVVVPSPDQVAEGVNCLQYTSGKISCFSSLKEANAHAAGKVIAIHYDNPLYTGGPSLSIQGDSCNGGGLNVPASWNDRISATWSMCSVIFFVDANFRGAYTTQPAGVIRNIAPGYDNRTSSMRYYR